MIIGLVGLIGSGKGTVAEILRDQGCQTDSFAAPLKDATAAIFGWPRDMLEGDTEESREYREQVSPFWAERLGIENFTPRLALQLLGTEVLRDTFHENIWTDSLERRASTATAPVVVSDVRFPNELDVIKRTHGVVVRVVRGDYPEWWNYAADANAGNKEARVMMETKFAHVHRSEWSLAGSDVDYVIKNNGTIEELRNKVEVLYKWLTKE